MAYSTSTSNATIIGEIRALRREFADLASLIKADVRTADRLVTVREACEITGLKRTAIYKRIHDGRLPCKKDGGAVRISLNELQKYISH